MRLPISRLFPAFIFSVLFFFSLSATAWGGTFTVFGPQTYVRGTGTPVTVTNNFTVLNPNTTFTLRLHNGSLVDSSTDLVSSTTVTVNGVVIVAPNDLNQNIAEVDKPVTLLASNEIDVQVRGAPGGSMTVDIIGVDNDPPTIAAAASPAANAAGWNNTDVTVTFTCADALSGVASCTPPALVSTEGANQIVSGTATDNAGNTASAQVSLSIDKTPPAVTIASPVDGSTVGTPTLQLSGTVSDALSGVASISCNAVAALVQMGSFSCSVDLITGPNSITVMATDVAGNTTTKLLSVTLATAPVITDFNPKSGPAGTLITLTGTNLDANNSTQVTLNQTGGGTIAAPISSASPTTITFVIPAGASTGAVTVTSNGQSGTSASVLAVTAASSFTLTAGPSTATVLQSKTAAYSISLASTDGFSGLAALSVSGLPTGVTGTFVPAQITAGQTSILTVSAPATEPVGNSTLTISATATVDGILSTQTASVALSVQLLTTSFFGRVVEADTNETPLPGIVITFLSVDDAGQPTACSASTVADAAGNFLFANLPDGCTGRQLVQYDGLTAADGEAYAGVNLAYSIVKGEATGPELVHLPDIQDSETVMVKQNSPTEQTFNFKSMPGISVTVYPNTVFTLPDGTQPDPFPFTGVEVPVDRLPERPRATSTAVRAFIVAFQPADTISNQPVAVSFPNFINTPPGVNMELDTLDPVIGVLVKYGTGTVSGDGMQIIPDFDPAHPGHRYGIQHFDWHGPMAPAPNAVNPGPDPNSPTAGDPVDPASGLFILRKTDMAFGSTRGHVAITRTYRTLAGTPGPFGVGTSHNYSYQLNTFSFIQGQGFITLIMPDGNQFQFVLQPDGTFVNTTIPMFKGAVLTAAPPKFVLRYKDGVTYTFQNPSTGGRVAYLNSIKDRNGNVTTLVRGNSADPIQITQIVDPVGRTLNFTYDNFDRITSMTDPIGRVVSYTYNGQGTLDTVTDAAGGITRYTYDAQNRMTSITDPRGIIFLQNTYDANGRVLKQVAADGGVTQFSYTLLNPILGSGTTTNTSPVLLTVVTDPRGNQTTYHYNAQGFLIDMTDSLGERTIYEREAGTNLLLSVTDPLNRVTTFTHDSAGNVTSSTRLAGTPNAVTTRFTYDPIFNERTSITDPLNNVMTFSYDAAGNLINTVNALGGKASFTYDQFGEPITATDPLGNTTHFSYVNGNVASITDPLGRVTRRVTDAVGRINSLTNPAGQTSSYQHTPLNQIAQTTDPLGGSTAFTYDGNGNLIRITDALGHATAYTYDSMDRVTSRTDPLGNIESFQYDLNGNLTQFTDRRGVLTTYSYDPLNRKTLAQFGTESSIDYAYDAAGRLTQAVDSASGPITRIYDGLDELSAEVTSNGSVSYTYDTAGRRTSMKVSGQSPIDYVFDAANHLTNLTQGSSTVSIHYDPDGRRISATLPNGVTMSYQYDAASELTAINYSNGAGTLGNLTYTYDPTGWRTQVGGSLARTGLPPELTSAGYNAANQLTNSGLTLISYDKNGNMLSDGTNSFTWNARNQLAAVNGVPLRYDAFGRRTQNATGTQFVYDGMNPVQELAGGAVMANLLTGLDVDEYYQRTDSAGSANYLTDALGSTVSLTDPAGSTLASYTYDPFGKTTVSGSSANHFQYTGRENEGTGLYYYRARYYSPTLQRFISEDPVAFLAGDTNLYAYTFNNPVNFADATGRCPWCIVMGIGAAIGGATEAYKKYLHGCRDIGALAGAFGRGALAGGLAAGIALVGAFELAPVVGSVLGVGAGTTAAAAGAGAIGGAAGGAVNVALNEGIETGSINGADVAEGAIVGAAAGGLAAGFGPEVNGGENFNPWTSPRTFGPRAQKLYVETTAAAMGASDEDIAHDSLKGRKDGDGCK